MILNEDLGQQQKIEPHQFTEVKHLNILIFYVWVLKTKVLINFRSVTTKIWVQRDVLELGRNPKKLQVAGSAASIRHRTFEQDAW